MDVNPGTFLRQPPSPHRPSDRDDDDVAVHVRQFAHSLAEGEAQIVTTRTQGTQSSTRHQSSSSSEPGSRLGPRARGQDIKTGIFVSDDSCGPCVHGSLFPLLVSMDRHADATPHPRPSPCPRLPARRPSTSVHPQADHRIVPCMHCTLGTSPHRGGVPSAVSGCHDLTTDNLDSPALPIGGRALTSVTFSAFGYSWSHGSCAPSVTFIN